MHLRSLLAAALTIAAALAGCSDDGGSASAGGISVSGDLGTQGPYTFSGPSGAENYTWDLGDQLTRAYGREVTHTYDIVNGVLKVRLTTVTDGKEERHGPLTLTLGTGQNTPGSYVLGVASNWTVVGETLRFSASESTDPDGDNLRYSWGCVRDSDIVKQTPHPPHGPAGGIPYGTKAQGKVAVRHTPSMPSADRVVAGNLCDTLGFGASGLDATIEGKIPSTGLYVITLTASDGVNPATFGTFNFYVTEPGDRPDPLYVQRFTGNLTVGIPDPPAGVPKPEETAVANQAEHEVRPTLFTYSANVTLTLTDPAAAADGRWTLLSGDIVKGTGGVGRTEIPVSLQDPKYTLRVELTAGAAATYDLLFEAPLIMNPTILF